MAHGRAEDAALSVFDREDHWFVFACAEFFDSPVGFVFGVGVGCCENGHIFCEAALVAVEFVFSVEPDRGQSAHDGVFGFARGDFECVGVNAFASVSGPRVAENFSVSPVDVGAGFFIATAPSADAHHLVECGPVFEGVVYRVSVDHASAVFHVRFEGLLDAFGPGVAVVFDYDDIVFGKVGIEFGHVGFCGRAGDCIDLKETSFFENLLVVC